MELKTAKGRLLLFIGLILFLPLLEFKFHFITSAPLKGYTEDVANPGFSWRKWWDGSYQRQKGGYINDRVGFRPDLVRLNNQLDFWLFKKLHSGDVFVGADNYLFSRLYTDEYYGNDFLGTDTIRKLLIKLKGVQDTLERSGKTFIFAYTPSKPYWFPEKIPAFLRQEETQKTNYRVFKKIADSLKINQIDFNEWLRNADTTGNIIVGRQGAHWTMYGALLAADSIIRYIERARRIKMPSLKIDSRTFSQVATGSDDDLAAIANLVFPMTRERFTYASYHYKDTGAVKPRAIYTGDSFVWTLISDGLMHHTNTDWEFWCYFYQVWREENVNGNSDFTPRDKYPWKQSLLNTDCFIVLINPTSLKYAADKHTLITVLYNFFYPEKKDMD